jgi:methylenetetrahydrofolate dehydrogenase (NADP+)/methenyltetrahydrofolate cyclohydrolase
MAIILRARDIYSKYKECLKQKIKKVSPITLASLSIGYDYSSSIYLSSQRKAAQELGVDYLSIRLKKNTALKEIIKKIKQLNKRENITGILINKPFPQKWEEEIFSAIDPRKDIEGVHPSNLGRIFLGKPLFVSPTVLSILEFIKMSKMRLEGKETTIVGFSTIIGKPLAVILGEKLSTVSITHIATYRKRQLSFYVKKADILISAVGKPNLIKGEWIKRGAVVIDVGIGEKNGKICGDVEFEKAKKRASFITPVPGGVGLLTTIFIFKNLIKAAEL